MEKGYERFLGFADLYDEGRPKLPHKAIKIIKRYINGDVDLIVDIGCGTGNSTEVCTNYAKKVIGIEPSKDMLNKAKEKENEKLSFQTGLGNNTGLDNNIADIVICSQAFHWMEPTSTISEISRVLKKGGVFAVIDADWLPVIDLRLEKLNRNLRELTMNLEKDEDTIIYPQTQHLNNLIKSNEFEFCREVCFDVEMEYDKDRFKKFILSKSNIQKAIRKNYKPVIEILENLDSTLENIFEGKTLNALFSYKMKIGIK